MIKHGSWRLHSESDSRWNANNEAQVGMFTMPEECKQKLDELKKKYGDPPEDLIYSYVKH